MSLLWEKFYPYIMGTIAFVLWSRLGITFPDEHLAAILSAGISFGAILAGFMGTAQAILMGLTSNLMDNVKSSGYISDLASYLAEAIGLAFIFATFSLLGFFTTFYPFGPFWILIAVSLSCAFFRVTKIMLIILRLP